MLSRFGSAIASVGDLDGNGNTDVAVGAPLEEDGQSGASGSIYIFNGISNKLQLLHSQVVPLNMSSILDAEPVRATC